jgi:hypothetical protein
VVTGGWRGLGQVIDVGAVKLARLQGGGMAFCDQRGHDDLVGL